MSIYFSEKFKKLRKAQDLTQDQIADIFHVSPQSVSRWETGVNFPDVEFLPHIAGFFKVTVDELLGTEQILGAQKSAEYIKEVRGLLNSGKVREAIETARQAVRDYPVNYELQAELMNALCVLPGDEFKNEIIETGERIINYCTSDNITLSVKHMLFMRYVHWGMKDEATRLVSTFPSEEWYTYGANIGYVLEGDAWRQNQQTCIGRYMFQLCGAIVQYANRSGADALQKLEWYKKTMQIYEIIYDDEGDAIVYSDRDMNNVYVARLYCEAGDADKALDYVEQAAKDAVYHSENFNRKGYNSSLMLGRSNDHEYLPAQTSRNMCWVMWEDWLTQPQFDLIRNEARFVKCVELLKEKSGELTA